VSVPPAIDAGLTGQQTFKRLWRFHDVTESDHQRQQQHAHCAKNEQAEASQETIPEFFHTYLLIRISISCSDKPSQVCRAEFAAGHPSSVACGYVGLDMYKPEIFRDMLDFCLECHYN
jgi:hypothetical protein